jgi:hypothetical protein
LTVSQQVRREHEEVDLFFLLGLLLALARTTAVDNSEPASNQAKDKRWSLFG